MHEGGVIVFAFFSWPPPYPAFGGPATHVFLLVYLHVYLLVLISHLLNTRPVVLMLLSSANTHKRGTANYGRPQEALSDGAEKGLLVICTTVHQDN